MRIALIGATGLVGSEMLQVLEESTLPISQLIPVGSERSLGKNITLRGKNYECIRLEDAVNAHADVALFSAGGNVSLEWAPRFAEAGPFVVDNSAARRMSSDHKLIVPEID